MNDDLIQRLRRTKQVDRRCRNCGHTMNGHTGLRYTGFVTTHSHTDCIRLLHADAEEAADALAAAQEENERLREALEWHPIETAPRDGAVLLYFGNRQWRDMHDNTVRLPEPRNTIERIEAGWCEDGDIRESGTGHSVWEEWREPENFPTYWMPMLTPPRAALGKEG